MATAGVIVSRPLRLAIARNSFRRCPTEVTPIFSRSWSVRSLRITKSISFSANAERIARGRAFRASPQFAASAALYGFDAIRSGPACRGSLPTLAKIEYPGPASARPYRIRLVAELCTDRGAEKPVNVRFGSKADIRTAKSDVRFTPNSDRKSGFPHKVMSALPPKSGHVRCTRPCLLRAKSGHRAAKRNAIRSPRRRGRPDSVVQRDRAPWLS